LGVALKDGFEQTLMGMRLKLRNPLFIPLYKVLGRSFSFTKLEAEIKENWRTIRSAIREYVRARKSGRRESKVGEKADLLTVFFNAPEIFDEETIIDELIDFFVAASQTT